MFRVVAPDGDLVTYSAYGTLNAWWQYPALQHFVRGRHVHDFGAGGLGWAHRLMQLGAGSVTAVDSLYKDRRSNYYNDRRSWSKCAPKRVLICDSTFHEYHLSREYGGGYVDVAFVSWPDVTLSGTFGLETLCHNSRHVIYVGDNFDGTACGSQQFWALMRHREVLHYAPARGNSLIVYGPKGDSMRHALATESAAMGQLQCKTPEWFPAGGKLPMLHSLGGW